MATQLDRLLEDIVQYHDSYRRQMDEAIRSFSFSAFRFDSWGACEGFMEQFFAHINAHIMDPTFAGNARMGMIVFRQTFEPSYGQYPERAIYERLMHGHEGGLNGFVQETADAVVELFAGRDIVNKVDRYMFSIRLDGIDAAAEEYMEKWGHLLPKDITSQGTIRLAPVLGKFLKQHPRLLHRLRGIR